MNNRLYSIAAKNVGFLTLLTLVGTGLAKADVDLLNEVNLPEQTDTPIMLSFIAGAPSTDLTFGGYQPNSFIFITDITLTSGASGNLLGQTWNFTPAPSGSFAFQSPDGSALTFGGLTTGSYDQFDQSVNTVIGNTYTVNFLLSNDPDDPTSLNNAPSGLFVSVSDAETVTPEPGRGMGLLSGVCLLGVCLFARRRLTRSTSEAS